MQSEAQPSSGAPDGKNLRAPSLQLPENLTLDARGLIYTHGNDAPALVCAPFSVVRVSKNSSNEGVALHIKFVGDTGPRAMMIMRADAHREGGSDIAWALQNVGLRVAPGKLAHLQLARFFALVKVNAVAEFDNGR